MSEGDPDGSSTSEDVPPLHVLLRGQRYADPSPDERYEREAPEVRDTHVAPSTPDHRSSALEDSVLNSGARVFVPSSGQPRPAPASMHSGGAHTEFPAPFLFPADPRGEYVEKPSIGTGPHVPHTNTFEDNVLPVLRKENLERAALQSGQTASQRPPGTTFAQTTNTQGAQTAPQTGTKASSDRCSCGSERQEEGGKFVCTNCDWFKLPR